MKKITYVLASGALIALLGAGTALADEHGSSRDDLGLNLGSVVSDLAHQKDKDSDINFGATVRVLVHEQNDNDNDQDNDHGRGVNATTTEKADFLARLGGLNGFAIGAVSSISGSTFTLNPFGANSTTTVTTNASTTFAVQGHATTSSALAVGSHVVVLGTTTSTSTPDTIVASFVLILSKGFGFLEHLFFE